jgi:hypothetical protein
LLTGIENAHRDANLQDPIRPGNFSRYPDFPFLMPNRHISGLI